MRHSCSYCTLQFNSIGNLESHIQARHSKSSNSQIQVGNDQPEHNDFVDHFDDHDNDGPTEAFHYEPTGKFFVFFTSFVVVFTPINFK